MNRRMVFYTVGKLILVEAGLLVLPAVVAAVYRESCFFSFLITMGIALVLGGIIMLVSRPGNRVIYAKEGFVTTALAWIMLSAVGALPFVISREIPSYFDAFFETVSGFTTTGASILTNVESLSKGILFWRSFTHWIGGMGILVFVLALSSSVSERSIHIMRAEMPGPIVGKLVPRAKQTAKILYIIYVCMTALQIILLWVGDMTLFESCVHAFGSAGTGGFGIKANSVAGYSTYSQWVITIFMFLFGVNFNMYYLLLVGKFKSAFKSAELWTYIGIMLTSVVIITYKIYPLYSSFSQSVLKSSFQVSSILTTTGFTTANYDSWPEIAKGILLVLMFIGGCAGSTAGGIKVSRLVLLFKAIRREFKKMIHPRSVTAVRLDGKKLSDPTVGGVAVYFALYIIIFFIIFLLLCFNGFNFTTNFSAVAACYNNVGPGFGSVGPLGSYAAYSDFSKVILSVAMLLGRLELFPLLFMFSPSTWMKK